MTATRMEIFIWGLAGLAALFVVWLGVAFNRLIRFRNRMREAWSGVDVQLKRRHELVPRLVECVKGYRAHERSLLEDLTLARAHAISAQGAEQAKEAENGLARNLRTVFAVAEAYPDLKANQTFQQLSAALIEVEDQIQYARRYYNGAVRDNNIEVESFPSLIAARLFGFASASFFELESSIERQAPEVKM